jgi:DNA primase
MIIKKHDNIENFIRSLGKNYYKRGDEIIFVFCPFCDGGINRDKNTFLINSVSGLYNCYRASCNKSGTFYSFLKEFSGNNNYFSGIKNKNNTNYNKKMHNKEEQIRSRADINQEIWKNIVYFSSFNLRKHINRIEYWNKRGIGEKTLNHFNVGYIDENDDIIEFLKENGFNEKEINYSGIKDRDKDCYVIPVFSGLKIITIRFRKTRGGVYSIRSSMWNDWQGAHLYFSHFLSNNKYVFVVEGEPDLWTLFENNLNGVCLPGVNNCHKELNRFVSKHNVVYICFDSDTGGENGFKKILREIKRPIRKICLPEDIDLNDYYNQCEDKNDFMLKIKELAKKSIKFNY